MTMKFIQEHWSFTNDLESKVEYTIYKDGSIHDVMQSFREFLLASGYSPDRIKEYIGDP